MHCVKEDSPNNAHHVIEFDGGEALDNQTMSERFDNSIKDLQA